MRVHLHVQRRGITDISRIVLHFHRQRVAPVRPLTVRRKVPPATGLGQLHLPAAAVMRDLYRHPVRIRIDIFDGKARRPDAGDVITPVAAVIRAVQRDDRHRQGGVNGKLQRPRRRVARRIRRLHRQRVFTLAHVARPAVFPDPGGILRRVHPVRITVQTQTNRIHIPRCRHPELRTQGAGQVIAGNTVVVHQLDTINGCLSINSHRQRRRLANVPRLVFHFYRQRVLTVRPVARRGETPASVRTLRRLQHLPGAAMLNFHRDITRIVINVVQ
ncbi:hypothetical protein SAEN8230_21380 [Salmonella enterica subsp. arizonae]